MNSSFSKKTICERIVLGYNALQNFTSSCWSVIDALLSEINKRKEEKGMVDLPANLDGYHLPLGYSTHSYTEQLTE